jgi:hypothetical protein
MKKYLLFVLLLAAGLSLFGAEPGTILSPLGSYAGIGKLTEMEIIHDLYGGAYILYIDDGEFHILRQSGGALAPYAPEGFNRKPKQARNLRSFEGASEQYTAFIGREGGRDELFLFGVNYKGELEYYPLGESAGTINGYFLAFTPGAVQIYILSGERLYCLSRAGTPEAMSRFYPISRPGEKVSEFDIILQAGQGGSWGWYAALADGIWELSLFSMKANDLLVREKAGTFQAQPRVIAGEDSEGRAIYKIINGADVSVYRGRETGFFKDFVFTSPGTIINYFTITGGGGEIGLLLAEDGVVDLVYIASTGAASVPVLRPLLAMDRDGFRGMQPLGSASRGEYRFCLFFSLEGKPQVAIINSEAGLITMGIFNGSGTGAAFLYSGVAESNTNNNIVVPRICILDPSGDISHDPSFLFYRYDRNNWTLEWKIAAPINTKNRPWLPETALVLNPFYMKSEIIPMADRDMLFLYDLSRDVYQVLEKQKHRWSRKINDTLFAVLSGEGGIQLYRLEG